MDTAAAAAAAATITTATGGGGGKGGGSIQWWCRWSGAGIADVSRLKVILVIRIRIRIVTCFMEIHLHGIFRKV